MKCKITIITSRFTDLKKLETVNGVEIIRVPIFMRKHQTAASLFSMLSYFPSSFFAGYRCLKNRKYDLIHSMFAVPSAPSAMVLSKLFRVPHLLSILGGDIYDPSKILSPHKTPILRSVVQLIVSHSDKVVALSNDIRTRALQYYKTRRPIDIIHLGIPRPIIKDVQRSDYGFSDNEIIIVTVGRLVPRKGVGDLLEIVKRLNQKNVKLLVIGEGPIKNSLINQSQRLGIQENVDFLGFISDDEKFKLLSISDIYVTTSMHEGFGIVFLEAMSTGLPIISYDKGGQKDFLKDGQTGYLVNYKDEDLFLKRLQNLCTQAETRKAIMRHNRNYIKSFFIETCALNYFDKYRAISNTHKP